MGLPAIGFGAYMFLYNFWLDYLARALRANASIQGVTVGNSAHKLAIFVDDLQKYTSSPGTIFSCILLKFQTFGDLSKRLFWALSYLDTQILISYKSIFSLNFTPLSDQIKVDLLVWNKLPLLRHSLKINFLPCILYLIEALPIHVLSSFFYKPHLSALYGLGHNLGWGIDTFSNLNSRGYGAPGHYLILYGVFTIL